MKVKESYSVYLSTENTNKIQAINHWRINNYNDIAIKNAKCRHQIPEYQMEIAHPRYESNSIQSSNTKLCTEVDDLNNNYLNILFYHSDNSSHAVPMTRPLTNSFITHDSVPEYKKNAKEKSKIEYNPATETRNSLELFHKLSENKQFTLLNAAEKSRQPWVDISLQRDKDLREARDSTLLCYKRDDLKKIKIPKVVQSRKRKNDCDLNKNLSIKKHIASASVESEVLNIIAEYRVITFSKLIELIRDRHRVDANRFSTDVVLKYLPSVALCIRGHWVIKSEVYYKICPREGKIHMESLCPARDYILCMFYSGLDLTAKKLQSVTKMSSETATELLSQLSERVDDPKTGNWKFPAHDYDFIWRHGDVSDQQIKIMDQKVIEVCAKYKLKSLAGKSDSYEESKLAHMMNKQDKRMRTYSSVDEGHTLLNSPEKRPNLKRMRQNSTPAKVDRSPTSEAVDYTQQCDRSCMSNHVPDKYQSAIETNNEEYEEFYHTSIKEEPDMQYDESSSYQGYEDDNQSNIKLEASEYFSEKHENTITIPVPSTEDVIKDNQSLSFSSNILKDIKQYVLSQMNLQYILPVSDLADAYRKDYFPKLKTVDVDSWKNIDKSKLISQITTAIIDILNESMAERIDILWPKIKAALPEQTLYFYCNDSQSVQERPFFNAIVTLLKANGQFVIGDLKKEMSSNRELRMSLTGNDNMLRDRLKKYCLFVNRKYFLKHTVTMTK